MTTLVLAGAACIAQVTGRTATGQRDARALLWLVVAAAAFLYPFALGLTYFDPYALGFGSVEFLTVLLLIALAAWWARLYLIVFIVLAAALAFLAGAYESRNLWDYLIDPLVSFYALVRLPAAMRR
jgi:multisubunit Na+/H+ antiporter MnhF subunit